MLDKPIFPMSYGVFIRILRRLLLVAGFPLLPRCYAFRVGAGAEFDGCLSSALRNFIMSHSSDVYENNYMSEQVREDIVRCRFGAFAGTNDPLFDLLRDLTTRNDPGAPINPTPEQKLALEDRQDVTELRNKFSALQICGSKTDILRAKARLEDLRQRLYDLVVAESRKTYFAEAAKLRSRGLSTSHLRSSAPPPCSHHAALGIDCLVALFTGHTISDIGKPAKEFVFDDGAEERSEKALSWLLCYMVKAWTLLDAPGSPFPASNQQMMEMAEEKPLERSTCFICMSDFGQRGNLTRHVKKDHLQILSAPFECPECARLGLPPHTTRSPHEWSDHTETVHGKMHASRLTAKLSSDSTAAQESAVVHRCFVCQDGLPASRACAIKHYGRHTTLPSTEQLFPVWSARLSRLRVRRATRDTRCSAT